MKRLFFIATLTMATLNFTACKLFSQQVAKETIETADATLATASEEDTTPLPEPYKVVALCFNEATYGLEVIAEMDYSDDMFVISALPEKLDDVYLSEIYSLMPEYYTDMKVSDKKMRRALILLEVRDSNNAMYGTPVFGNKEHQISTHWYYSDRDVTQTGIYRGEEDITKYSLKLKKGWNVVYSIIESIDRTSDYAPITTSTITSTKPNVALSWDIIVHN